MMTEKEELDYLQSIKDDFIDNLLEMCDKPTCFKIPQWNEEKEEIEYIDAFSFQWEGNPCMYRFPISFYYPVDNFNFEEFEQRFHALLEATLGYLPDHNFINGDLTFLEDGSILIGVDS